MNMMAKLVICFCICLAVLIGSLAGFGKGVDLADSEKSNVNMIGSVMAMMSVIFMLASTAGVIVFAIKLFIFYLYGAA